MHANMATGKMISAVAGDPSVDLVKDAWTELRFDVNLDANTVAEYYNNQLLTTHNWRDTGDVNSLPEIQGMDLYANGADPVYYDNLNVASVPEPATLTALALGGLSFLRRRRVK